MLLEHTQLDKLVVHCFMSSTQNYNSVGEIDVNTECSFPHRRRYTEIFKIGWTPIPPHLFVAHLLKKDSLVIFIETNVDFRGISKTY